MYLYAVIDGSLSEACQRGEVPSMCFPPWRSWNTATSDKRTLWTDAGVDQNFREIWEPLVHTSFRGNQYGPIPWCLAFRGNLYGPMALKGCQTFPPRLALVHGWLFPEPKQVRLGAHWVHNQSSATPFPDRSFRTELGSNFKSLRNDNKILRL